MSLTVLYPLVGLENTVIAMVMFDVDSTLCGVSFEGFFCLDGFVTASGSVYVDITKARIVINED